MAALRRYTPLAPSRGTLIPAALRAEVLAADRGCVGPRVGMPGECAGHLELDHVRSSGALGRKSPSVKSNLVSLCNLTHHRLKTLDGRLYRPKLLAYVAQRDGRGEG